MQLRRSGLDFAGRIELPPLSIDMLAGTVSLSGNTIAMTQKELQILCCLVLAAGKRVSGKELYRRAWGGESEDYQRNVEVTISRLRKRLELDAASPFGLTATRAREQSYVFRKVRFD